MERPRSLPRKVLSIYWVLFYGRVPSLRGLPNARKSPRDHLRTPIPSKGVYVKWIKSCKLEEVPI